jgi:NDP-sugar pyrophosphorylase family protein
MVILAGGLGTRMRPTTDQVPKALIGVLGRPFADWQLELIAGSGVNDVVYSVGHLGEQIEAHVGNGARWGLSIRYSYERSGLLGTGGALRLAVDRGLLDDPFYVLYGDSYLHVNYAEVADRFRNSGRPALMTVYRNDGALERSNACYVDGRVTLYDKRSAEPSLTLRYVDYGLSVLEPSVVAECIPSGVKVDLSDTYHDLSIAGRLAGHEVRSRFYEVGSPGGVADLERLFRQADRTI